jgi:hypothetical protein
VRYAWIRSHRFRPRHRTRRATRPFMGRNE